MLYCLQNGSRSTSLAESKPSLLQLETFFYLQKKENKEFENRTYKNKVEKETLKIYHSFYQLRFHQLKFHFIFNLYVMRG